MATHKWKLPWQNDRVIYDQENFLIYMMVMKGSDPQSVVSVFHCTSHMVNGKKMQTSTWKNSRKK